MVERKLKARFFDESNFIQLFLRGYETQTIFFGKEYEFEETETTVLDVKTEIHERLRIPLDKFLLLYQNQVLDGENENKTLRQCGISDNSTIYMCLKLLGGARLSFYIILLNDEIKQVYIDSKLKVAELKTKIAQSKKVPELRRAKLTIEDIELDDNLTFEQLGIQDDSVIAYEEVTLFDVDGVSVSFAPDMISYDDSQEARAEMPCGHFISKDSMASYLISEAMDSKLSIHCPGVDMQNKKCGAEWDINLCKKIAMLTREENDKLEATMAKTLFYQQIDGRECPFCKTFYIRQKGSKNIRMNCPVCKSKGKSSEFCYLCLRKWQKKEGVGEGYCGHDQCSGSFKEVSILQVCGVINIQGVGQVPSIRACTVCFALIEHNQGCKHMTCKNKHEFCFICLNPWRGHNNSTCAVAPRQVLQQ
ncbi:probable e3 ubiquitin-protein ligase rnf144a-a [Stylonychia lemnae]|uniref:RBR-type E3 ubiquitin transferase n=1 Tax=Stylonychia lemnae TaxID=5949 RepID=A0A078AV12_STYLE|nr:probable e3 ubiquitin-protein ligase rnf144a-a [Stylonychia lemnae]|eukprot:CDW85092.1 probable e3 ubiquitin-protein ligase rnf144a-a [Stylonychia lemnae]